jgi:hypothetical protein
MSLSGEIKVKIALYFWFGFSGLIVKSIDKLMPML